MRPQEILYRIKVSENVNIIGKLRPDDAGGDIYCAKLNDNIEITGYRDYSAPMVEIVQKCGKNGYVREVLGNMGDATKIVYAMEVRFKELASGSAAAFKPLIQSSQKRYSVDTDKGESLPVPDWFEYCERQGGVSDAMNSAAAHTSY